MATGAAAELIDIQHSDLCAAGHLLWPCDGHLRSVCDFPPLRGHEGAQQAARASDGRRREFGELQGSNRRPPIPSVER